MKLTLREIATFGMLGALMFASKKLMEALPNIHLIAMFIVAFTVVYRFKALFPIYIYIFLDGLFGGFNVWWVPYLYIWALLWGAAMLIPKNIPSKWLPVVYAALCGSHGFLFGLLYSPAQALFFGLSFKQTLAWVAAGLPFDITHGISNMICSLLVVPIVKALRYANAR